MAGPAGYRRSDDPSRLRLGGAHANGNSATHAIAPPYPKADGYPRANAHAYGNACAHAYGYP